MFASGLSVLFGRFWLALLLQSGCGPAGVQAGEDAGLHGQQSVLGAGLEVFFHTEA